MGSAVGDALGAPFEFGPAGGYRRRFPGVPSEPPAEMVGGGGFGWAPGEFTDDTQMAVLLAEVICERGGIDPVTIWADWRAWREHANDVGVLTNLVLEERSWRGAALRGHEASQGRSAANGALMRVAGLAVAYAPQTLERAVEAARFQAHLTHHDPAAGWGAAIATTMVHRGLNGGRPLDALDEALAMVDHADQALFAELLDASWHPGAEEELPNGTVWTCLAQAVWALRTTSSFEDAVVEAIELGGDADTVACVTGMLAGATYGLAGVPERWRREVNGQARSARGLLSYDHDGLVDLADRLLALSS